MVGRPVAGQYSMHLQLKPSDAIEVGNKLEVTCDVWNLPSDRGVFVVWLRRSHGVEVELGTNNKIVDQLVDRYNASFTDERRPAKFARVSYYLKITGTVPCRSQYCVQ